MKEYFRAPHKTFYIALKFQITGCGGKIETSIPK